MGLSPVRDIIVRGYSFLFARFFTVVGLGWLPAAFYAIACTWLIRTVSLGALNAPPAIGAFNQYSLVYLAGLLLATAFFGPPMLIPFTREALGLHDEPVAAHFSYGPREWRLFVALLRFYGMIAGALFVLIVASGIAISKVAPLHIVWLGVPLTAWLNALSAIIVLGAAVFLSVRLGFFLSAIATLEGHARITRAWTLSLANFWRVAAVTFAIVIPVALVVLVFEYALWGSELDAATRLTHSPALAIFKLQYDHAAGIAALLAIALTAANALFASAAAAAYSMLDARETEASAPEANWGINRAPVYAHGGTQPIVARHGEAREAVGPAVAEPAQIEPSFVAETHAEPAVAEADAALHVVAGADAEGSADTTNASEGATAPDSGVPVDLVAVPADTPPAPPALPADGDLAGEGESPAEMRDAAAETTPTAAEAPVFTLPAAAAVAPEAAAAAPAEIAVTAPSVLAAMPPLDPAGLAQAAHEREPA